MERQKILRVTGGDALPARLRGGVVAIGNFDGVHRGHQAVLEGTIAQGRMEGAPILALTFVPHPREVFRPDVGLFILTPPPMKASLLEILGFDAVVELPFDREFAAMPAEAFVSDILVSRLGISHAVTGFHFHFGRNREGNPAFLKAAGDRRGFAMTQVDAFNDEGGEVVSSSRIRDLLSEGATTQAAGLLGYRYTIEERIVSGKQLGRTLGYPTANMILPASTTLKHGIYAVRFRRENGAIHDGVASFGLRPTVEENGAPVLETFLFDFSGSLYGETCRVSLFGFLRAEQKFDTLESLIAQMRRDESEARTLLGGMRPLSRIDARLAFGDLDPSAGFGGP